MSESWLEVSMVVDGELAEAVAEVLARFAPTGVVIESTAVTAKADDAEGRAIGPLKVAAFLPVDEDLGNRRQELEQALWYLGRIQLLPEAQYRIIQETNWVEAWKTHYRPIEVGKRLIIVPAWLENPQAERVAIRIDPGMAFGTGTHPTTQLCLEFIDEYMHLHAHPVTKAQALAHPDPTQKLNVIDVGCGSGILSIAALKLGANYALGVDIDPQAMTACLENGRLNEVEGRLEVGVGSLLEIKAGDFGLQQAQLVMANILAPVLVKLLDEGLGGLVMDGGWLILSGILAEQSAQVEEALTRNSMRLEHKLLNGDWVALVGVKATS